jgi:RimJ/RimL family protein N-acetyltransferase
MKALETARLRLEPVTTRNANALWVILQHADLRQYQDLPNVGAAAFVQLVEKRPKKLEPGAFGRFEWLVYFHRSRKPLGWVSLRIAERERDAGEIGYSILREHRGQGVATEAVRSLVREAFEAATLRKLRAYCVPENVPSRHVLESNGFSYEGLLPHGATVNGRPVDVLSHVLDREAHGQSGNSMEIPASA